MKKPSTYILMVMLACMQASILPAAPKPFFLTSPSQQEQLRTNLYAVESDATTTLLDGAITQYDPTFSNAIDGMDARKMSNFSENIGMLRGTTTLVIERRHTIEDADTIFYKMWNVQQKTYQLEFITSALNHPGLIGRLEDNYLHSSVSLDLNGPNNINFAVNTDPASSAINRFRIIFATIAQGTLPLTFTSIKAFPKNNMISVAWTTANESGMKSYTVQRSTDGNHFSNASETKALNLSVNSYSWTDALPAQGSNYYRISSLDVNGITKFSEVLKVFAGKESEELRVFPNPVTDNAIHLQINNQPAGQYQLRLLNAFGQPVMVKQVQHAEGSSSEVVRPSQLIPKGMYNLEITRPDGTKMTLQLMF
jgi:hypothetical protein